MVGALSALLAVVVVVVVVVVVERKRSALGEVCLHREHDANESFTGDQHQRQNAGDQRQHYTVHTHTSAIRIVTLLFLKSYPP